MSAPLYDALLRQIGEGRARFHMPGHKGLLPPPLDAAAPFDLTELARTGSLTAGIGPVCETESRFSAFYGSGATLLSTGGSTLCIQAMLACFCPIDSVVLMARQSHLAAINAAALLGLSPVWLWPDEPSGVGTPGRISPRAVRDALTAHPDASAVYLTSPDYFGSLSDLSGIRDVCHRFGVPLLVDNAHGAHLALFPGRHPMAQGVDACCDSLHKTLPALTGAALLHLRDGMRRDDARRRMAAFGSTSPSYLIQLSADLLADRMDTLRLPWEALARRVASLRKRAMEKGVWATVGSSDPTRISLLFPCGERTTALGWLDECAIEAEYVSDRQIVLIPAPENALECVDALLARLPALDERPAVAMTVHPETVLPLRTAALAPAESILLSQAVGRIAAAPLAFCPPGLPIVMPGERFDEPLTKSAGTATCFVVQ